MKRGPIVTTASLTLTASLALTPTAALADGFRGGAVGGDALRRPPGGPPFLGAPFVPPPSLPPPLRPPPFLPPLLPPRGVGAPPLGRHRGARRQSGTARSTAGRTGKG